MKVMQENDIELNTQLSESSILNIEGSERYCTATFERAWSHYASVPDVEMLAASAFQAQDDAPETIVETMKIPRGVMPFSKFPIGDGVVSILPTGKQATRSVDVIWSLAHKGRVGAAGTLRQSLSSVPPAVGWLAFAQTTFAWRACPPDLPTLPDSGKFWHPEHRAADRCVFHCPVFLPCRCRSSALKAASESGGVPIDLQT